MIVWATGWAFALLLPLLLLLVWLWTQRKRLRASMPFSRVQLLREAGLTLRARLAKLPVFFKVVALVLAIIALARPQKADVKVSRNVEGIDIIIALDVSHSMLIEDMKPENRLEASKKTIKDFIINRVSDRIGLVVFSGESYTRVPLTLDYPIFMDSLKKVETTTNIKMGTAIGVALANAVGRLKDSTAKSRIIIFLTDGENNSGTIDPETALDIAKGYAIKIYSIGMGLDGQTRLPVYMNLGKRKIKRYRPIHSKVNEKLLKRMANETGGKYFRANTSRALEGVFAEINQLETTKMEVHTYTKYAELFPPYVQWALGFYLLSFLFSQVVFRRGP